MSTFRPHAARRGRAGVAALVGLLLVAVSVAMATPACGRRVPHAPTLGAALAARGGAAERTKAFLRVAIEGSVGEQRRAAFLAGLFACDARSPAAALTGFRIAAPPGGRGRLAAHRLVEALAAVPAGEALWREAAAQTWVDPEERELFLIRGGEQLFDRRDCSGASRLVAAANVRGGPLLARSLAVTARCGRPGAQQAARRLAISFPFLFGKLLPGESLARITGGFSPAEWADQARAWLDAGYPQPALGAALRGGTPGVLIGARAALRLRRSSLALQLAERVGTTDPEGWLERADAYRQLAWGGDRSRRARPFADMLRCARQAERLLPKASPLRGRAGLQAGEALTELARFADAAPLLARDDVRRQARYDWVLRRFFFLQAGRDRMESTALAAQAATTRGRRVADYWIGTVEAEHGDRRELERLAESGFPDLAAHWAAAALGRSGVAVALSTAPVSAPPPPDWAGDLLAAGRVGDAAIAWRSDLEAAGHDGPGWLGLVELADLPPLDAIPLLVRGQPQLATGPWTGLPQALVRRYLPLPWRAELELAARRAGVPPWVLAGLVRQESAWNPSARSAAGAVGLTQVLPATAAELVRGSDLPPSYARNLTDPEANLAIGALLLARWRAAIGGSWTAALACFNAGESRVREMWARAGRRDGPEFVESIEIPETWDYVHRVVLYAEGYRVAYWPEGKGYPWT